MSVEQAYRSINWTTVILVGAMIPAVNGNDQQRRSEPASGRAGHIVGDRSPYALLAGLFILTSLLGQLISNTATALIIIPDRACGRQYDGRFAQPVLMSITVASAGAFLTPVATPVNLMVMRPGRLCVQRLLEVGPAAADPVLFCRYFLGTAVLEVLRTGPIGCSWTDGGGHKSAWPSAHSRSGPASDPRRKFSQLAKQQRARAYAPVKALQFALFVRTADLVDVQAEAYHPS